MEISPASIVQVSDNGGLVEVDDDVYGLARQLRELDPELKLRYSQRHDFWAVYQEQRHPVTGELTRKQLVLTDQSPLKPAAIMDRMRQIVNGHYDLDADARRIEAEGKREKKHQMREELGEKAARLQHAFAKDLGHRTRRAFIPRSLELPPGVSV